MTPPRKIVHVDMDAFYASVEQRDRPELRGVPVVVAWEGPRSVVCAASYEARRFGIRSAMPALRARRLSPDAVFVRPDFTRYREVSRQVRQIFLRHTDLVEPLSLDEAYLDVTLEKTGLPSATETAKRIRAEIRAETGLTASAGVAPNKFLAKIASDWRKPDGLFVIRPHEVEEFLAPLPVAKLPGVGKATEGALAAIGIATVADLRQFEPRELERRFGRFGRRLSELAHGVDESPVRPDRPTVSVSSEDTFPEDLPLEALGPALDEAARRVWEATRRRQRQGRTVTLKLKTADFRIVTRRSTPAHPPRSAEELAVAARTLLERVGLPPETRYRLAGVGISNFPDEESDGAQTDLFADPA
ncbi:MAG: DNA polymerase IV [Acidobacteriota bacterium]